eukprot:1194268-Prorocentrum_minimum.AAC.4
MWGAAPKPKFKLNGRASYGSGDWRRDLRSVSFSGVSLDDDTISGVLGLKRTRAKAEAWRRIATSKWHGCGWGPLGQMDNPPRSMLKPQEAVRDWLTDVET